MQRNKAFKDNPLLDKKHYIIITHQIEIYILYTLYAFIIIDTYVKLTLDLSYISTQNKISYELQDI